MASSSQTVSSSHPSSAESPAPPRKYDVFLSFRGEDIRRTIIPYIYRDLQKREIETFMDETGLIRGTYISESLVTAIQESRSAIVVLSPNYADSRWCLEELTMIIQCMEEKGTTVIPIFYDVIPSDVRHQRGSYARAFSSFQQCLKVQMSDVKCLPPLVGFTPNWVNFDICISTKEFMNQSYYGRFFERKLTVAHRHLSRYLTLNTSMKYLPNWFIDVVTEKAEVLEYTGYMGLDILEEYHHGGLRALKYLGIIECHVVDLVLLNSRATRVPNTPVFESLEELYLEGVQLELLCTGELAPRSLSSLKLLNVRNCPLLGYALLTSNLLPCLRNLEIIHCESTRDARRSQLNYVFRFYSLETEKKLLPKLREITLCYLAHLRSICCGHPPSGVFRNLNSLAIHGCRKLMYIFEYHVAESLSQLELLWVEECLDLETVIESSRNTESNKVVFPKLKEMYLNCLPQLTWICKWGSVQCPSLEHLYLCMCPSLPILSASDFQSKNPVKANDEGHFAIIFERLFHRQFNPEAVPQFFSKKESDFSTGSSM
ncbi:hypothetical protein ACLB2K_021872 [Fragaria x ananassa]